MDRSAFTNKLSHKFSGVTVENASLVEDALRAYQGVQFVQVKLQKSLIRLNYDVQLTNLDELMDLLAEFDVTKYQRSLWWKWRWRFAKLIEQNIKANAAHVPHCCGKAPSSARRR
ncbi:hypothetical protein [Marinomonas fungiae]|uniref:hypothetical protein n=1 Tax=Marinomonas fungiae TaxID=1137284 RepID=UPI003A8E3D55